MNEHHHASETDLALFAGGDCGLFARLRVKRHLGRCGDCRDLLASFTDLRDSIRREPAQLPSDWNRIESEMRANIRLGLVAGECVREEAKATQGMRKFQFAYGAAAVVAVAGVGFFLHGLLPQPESKTAQSTVLESTGSGVALRTDKGSMTLLNHGDGAADQTVSAQGAVRAVNVDGDTGTVTITSVYVE